MIIIFILISISKYFTSLCMQIYFYNQYSKSNFSMHGLCLFCVDLLLVHLIIRSKYFRKIKEIKNYWFSIVFVVVDIQVHKIAHAKLYTFKNGQLCRSCVTQEIRPVLLPLHFFSMNIAIRGKQQTNCK